MKIQNRVLLGLFAAGVASVQPGQAGAQQGDLARGARAYGDTCGRCHNPRSPVERSDRDWVVIINHMRVRAGMTGQQVRDILAFLQASNHPEAAAVAVAGGAMPGPQAAAEDVVVSSNPADVARGQTLTAERGCIGCHLIDGSGGQIGPSLDGVVQSKGASYVSHKLINPAFNNAGTLMPNLSLDPDEVRALIAYLATIG